MDRKQNIYSVNFIWWKPVFSMFWANNDLSFVRILLDFLSLLYIRYVFLDDDRIEMYTLVIFILLI